MCHRILVENSARFAHSGALQTPTAQSTIKATLRLPLCIIRQQSGYRFLEATHPLLGANHRHASSLIGRGLYRPDINFGGWLWLKASTFGKVASP
jgi:hypothetical protein